MVLDFVYRLLFALWAPPPLVSLCFVTEVRWDEGACASVEEVGATCVSTVLAALMAQHDRDAP